MGFSSADGRCVSCPFTYVLIQSDGERGRKCWFSKKTLILTVQDKRKKACTSSHTIFPFSHEAVQPVCSLQSIIFTAVTDGREACCNYSYRYGGHLEVVPSCWKIKLLLSHKGQVFIEDADRHKDAAEVMFVYY